MVLPKRSGRRGGPIGHRCRLSPRRRCFIDSFETTVSPAHDVCLPEQLHLTDLPPVVDAEI